MWRNESHPLPTTHLLQFMFSVALLFRCWLDLAKKKGRRLRSKYPLLTPSENEI
jgi:hypothetical protein